MTRRYSVLLVAVVVLNFAGLCSAEEYRVLNASGTPEAYSRLERDPVTGKPFVPRHEWDETLLMRRFGELFRAFAEHNQRFERENFMKYPVIYVDQDDTEESDNPEESEELGLPEGNNPE